MPEPKDICTCDHERRQHDYMVPSKCRVIGCDCKEFIDKYNTPSNQLNKEP